MTELLSAAGALGPWFVAFVLVILVVVYAGEKLKLFEKDGPITRILDGIRNRELNDLRRQAELEKERRRLAAETESPELKALRAELATVKKDLADARTDLNWLRGERNDQLRRDRARARWERDMAMWMAENLPRMRAVDPAIPNPPDFTPLPSMLVLDDDIADLKDQARDDWSGFDQPDTAGQP